MPTAREILIAAIAKTCGIHPGGIADDQTLSDLGADSLEVVEITMEVEAALGTTTQLDAAFEGDTEPTIAQIVVAIDAAMENANA